jgi:hypothetical protein
VCDSAKKKKRKEGFIMKKILFVVLVLCMAAPAWARVDIWCEQVGDSNEVIVSFDASSEDPNLLRAIAVNIQADGVGKILDAKCKGAGGFWVSPGKAAGNVNTVTGEIDYDEPNTACVCPEPGPPPGTHPDTLPGLVEDSNGITIEMATLYEGAAPSMSGELIRVYFDTGCFNVTISENEIRGGVVMEDPDATVDVNCTGCAVEVGCFPCSDPNYSQWVAVGEPDSWCSSKGYLRQCKGDADGASETKQNYWVFVNDLTILLNGWGKAYPAVGSDIAADFDHKSETKQNYRVFVNDLTILLTNWGIANGPAPGCP